MIADDHEVVRAGLRSLVNRQEGWSVCGEAENGLEALSKAVDLKPDLIVLDISMPLMSGFQAATKIRELVPAAKIVVLSMHDVSAMPHVFANTGAHAFVCKTESKEKLLQAINAVLQAEQAATPSLQPPPSASQAEPERA